MKSQRIKITALLAPVTIYHHAARHASGYRPSAASRFAVVKDGDSWSLIHVRSGMAVNSALPSNRRVTTMTEKLTVASALDAATHLDWSAFDALPQVTPETVGPASWPPLTPSQRTTMTEFRAIAAAALSQHEGASNAA